MAQAPTPAAGQGPDSAPLPRVISRRMLIVFVIGTRFPWTPADSRNGADSR